MQHSGLYISTTKLLPELGAVIEGLDELEDVFNAGCLSEQGDSLLIKGFGFLQDVLFLREKEQVTLRWYLFALAYVLYKVTSS